MEGYGSRNIDCWNMGLRQMVEVWETTRGLGPQKLAESMVTY
jgi:hypothetical protein